MVSFGRNKGVLNQAKMSHEDLEGMKTFHSMVQYKNNEAQRIQMEASVISQAFEDYKLELLKKYKLRAANKKARKFRFDLATGIIHLMKNKPVEPKPTDAEAAMAADAAKVDGDETARNEDGTPADVTDGGESKAEPKVA